MDLSHDFRSNLRVPALSLAIAAVGLTSSILIALLLH
jgi:hypothetical protein